MTHDSGTPDWRDFYTPTSGPGPQRGTPSPSRWDRPAQPWAAQSWDAQSWNAPGPVPARPVLLPVRGAATATVVLSSAVLLGQVAQLLLLPSSGAGDLQEPGTGPTALDAAGGLTNFLLLLTFLAVCRWLRRARRNAEAISPATRHARSQVWVALGWCVPVVSLWFPYQVVRDVARASATGGRPVDPPVGTWWALWIGSALAALLSGGAAGVALFLPAVVPLLWVLTLISLAVTVAGFAAWVRVVSGITRIQEEARLAAPLPVTQPAW